MRSVLLLPCLLFVAAGHTPVTATADDAVKEAIETDRKQIEGKWKIAGLVINGNEAAEENKEKLMVANEADGTWSLFSEGKLLSKGTSSIDPTKSPKTIDFAVTQGEGLGNEYRGIYELAEKTRRMCFARPSESRPTALISTADNKHICVKFDRKDEE